MTYNEYHQVLEAGIKPSQLVVFKYSDQGVGVLEDGLYANGDKLKDPKYADVMASFVAASIKGWAYAVKHTDEGAKISLAADTTGAQNVGASEVDDGRSREADRRVRRTRSAISTSRDYKRTVEELKEQKIITKEPEGAYTHAVYDAAKKVKM